MPDYNIIHNDFKLNGIHYNFTELKVLSNNLVKNGKSFEKEIGQFLIQWLNDNHCIEAKTSGSTGKPKIIEIKKQAMVNSAIATGDFFKLKPKNTALLSLPANYIAGKMMLVRAMVLGLALDYIEPKSNLIIDTEKEYNFSAMVPMQLQENINKLKKIKTLIVGGASVSNALISKIKTINTTVFETYGMTETVSHVAVKQLNNFINENISNSFKVLPNVSISQDNRQCLVVESPKVSDVKVITNDIVELHSKTEFSWLGRFDNVINSGGVKIFPEQIEQQLQDKITSRFFIASEEDETLGEQVILVVEGVNHSIYTSVFENLKAFNKPKAIYYVDAFVETHSGKIQRKKTLQLLKK